MKKSVFMFLVTVATVAAIGFAVTGCNSKSGGSGGLTITDIPAQFDGMWVNASGGGDGVLVIGVQSLDRENPGAFTFSKIVGGKVSIPIWNLFPVERWAGNNTLELFVDILPFGASDGSDNPPDPLEKLTFYDIEFKDGNATVKYEDGR